MSVMSVNLIDSSDYFYQIATRTNAILLLIVVVLYVYFENQEGATLAPLSNFFYKYFLK